MSLLLLLWEMELPDSPGMFGLSCRFLLSPAALKINSQTINETASNTVSPLNIERYKQQERGNYQIEGSRNEMRPKIRAMFYDSRLSFIV